MTALATFDDFMRLDIRSGTIVEALPFPEARKAAYRLRVDLGPDLGIKQSSAQITDAYELADLVGRQVMAVTNFAPKRIGPWMSEVLVLGLDDEKGHVRLIVPEAPVPNGQRLY